MTESARAVGIVKTLKKNKKGVQLADGQWYASNFFQGEVACNVGDEVELTYKQNGIFMNLETLKVTKPAASGGGDTSTHTYRGGGDDAARTAAMLTSYVKDIMVATLAIPIKEGEKPLSAFDGVAIAQAVTSWYTIIKEQLNADDSQ